MYYSEENYCYYVIHFIFISGSRVYPSRDAMLEGALETAEVIASKSPTAVQVSKVALVYARDHSVSEGLDNIVSTILFEKDFLVLAFNISTIMQFLRGF